MSHHVCPKCGKQGEAQGGGKGDRHHFLAVCDRDDCPPTLAAKRLYAMAIERTPDNAAGQVALTGNSSANGLPSPAPAAPATPWAWSDKVFQCAETAQEVRNFARSLETLVHQQHEALREAVDYMDGEASVMVMGPLNDALAAYGALKKECEK